MATSNCSNCGKETPLIPPKYICKHCSFPIQKKENNPLEEFGFNIPFPQIVKKENSTKHVSKGWLIVHTENKTPKHYEIKVGDNYFGRETDVDRLDIPIENDNFVSRCHARINMYKDMDFQYSFEVIDDGKGRKGKPSTNGTYVNGNKIRLAKEQSIKLQDGDTIQVGMTKLVFKSTNKVSTVNEAITEVVQSDYTATVMVNQNK